MPRISPGRDTRRIRAVPLLATSRAGRRWRFGPDVRLIASAAFRSLVLIAVALLLIFVLVPAALVGAALT